MRPHIVQPRSVLGLPSSANLSGEPSSQLGPAAHGSARLPSSTSTELPSTRDRAGGSRGIRSEFPVPREGHSSACSCGRGALPELPPATAHPARSCTHTVAARGSTGQSSARTPRAPPAAGQHGAPGVRAQLRGPPRSEAQRAPRRGPARPSCPPFLPVSAPRSPCPSVPPLPPRCAHRRSRAGRGGAAAPGAADERAPVAARLRRPQPRPRSLARHAGRSQWRRGVPSASRGTGPERQSARPSRGCVTARDGAAGGRCPAPAVPGWRRLPAAGRRWAGGGAGGGGDCRERPCGKPAEFRAAL